MKIGTPREVQVELGIQQSELARNERALAHWESMPETPANRAIRSGEIENKKLGIAVNRIHIEELEGEGILPNRRRPSARVNKKARMVVGR